MPDTAERLRECHDELRTLSIGGRGHLADTCLEGARELEKVNDAANRAYEYLQDPGGDTAAEVVEQLRWALRS